MTPYDLVGSIYNVWLPLVSIALCLIILVLMAFPLKQASADLLRIVLAVGTVIEFELWLFMRYGFNYGLYPSYLRVVTAEPTALFFTLLGLTASLVLTPRLPSRFRRVALAAFFLIIAVGIFPFIQLISRSFVVFGVALVVSVMIFFVLLVYTT
jgi:hypothetical protein